METHAFNEQNKRLEPIDDTCVFCGKRHAVPPDDNLYIPLFKEEKRLNVLVYRRVSFKRINVGLAICPDCKSIRARQKKRLWLYSIAGGMLTSIICLFLCFNSFEEFAIIMALLMGVAGAGCTFAIAKIVINKRSLKKDGILNEQDAAYQYEIVRALIGDGWTFNQPTA